ncbi:putative E3 ubiquitin-protein ligase TRIML1, partial [Acipenser ruthenus]
DTANTLLYLSDSLNSVREEGIKQDLPDNPEGFEPVLSVPGSEGFTLGKHYWEVEVGTWLITT